MMKAFVKLSATNEEIELSDVAMPAIDADELLVRVKAVGVGIHDSYFLPPEITYPYPIGIEAAGVVDKVGGDVTVYKVGDRITFVSAMQPKGGTWAEYAAVKASSLIVPVPEGMDFAEAAAVPVAGNTILRAMEQVEPIPEGGTFFIAGGSGAIGTLAIQLARKNGWRVAASASKRNHDYLRELGAEFVVDYHDADWVEQVLKWMPEGVDGAMAVQPKTTAESMKVVRDGGAIISISGDQVASERGVRVEIVSHLTDVREALTQMVKDIYQKNLRVELEDIYPFEKALDALAKVQTRRARGKSVLRVE